MENQFPTIGHDEVSLFWEITSVGITSLVKGNDAELA